MKADPVPHPVRNVADDNRPGYLSFGCTELMINLSPTWRSTCYKPECHLVTEQDHQYLNNLETWILTWILTWIPIRISYPWLQSKDLHTWIVEFHDTRLRKTHLHVPHHSVRSALRQRRRCFLKEKTRIEARRQQEFQNKPATAGLPPAADHTWQVTLVNW